LAADTLNLGELVAVVGYPMGVLGMVVKSAPAVYDRLAYRRDDQGTASELAPLSLIRPSSTCGHLGDMVGDKLIYDAPTAHVGSGGPRIRFARRSHRSKRSLYRRLLRGLARRLSTRPDP
jgi:hypothetical protein